MRYWMLIAVASSLLACTPPAGVEHVDLPIDSTITRPGVVAVDAPARRKQLQDVNALDICKMEAYAPYPPEILHKVDAPRGYGLDLRFWGFSDYFRALGANCLAGDQAMCEEAQRYAMEWARNSRIRKPRGGKDSGIFWGDTLTVNLWLFPPMISALGVAEQFSPLPEEDRKILDAWLKAKIDAFENGLRNSGYYTKSKNFVNARRAANNHAVISSSTAMAYGAWANDEKYFRTGLEQWYITLESMREDGSLPIETRRGARSQFYTGNTLSGLISLAERAAVQGIDLYGASPGEGKTIHRAVGFLIDSIEQPDLILQYARANYEPGPDKDYRVQNWVWTPSIMGWLAPYMARFPDHPNTLRLVARREHGHAQPQSYLTGQLDEAVRTNGRTKQEGWVFRAGGWVGSDVECFYSDPRLRSMPM